MLPPVTGVGAHDVSFRSAVVNAARPSRALEPIDVNVPPTYRVDASGDSAIVKTAPPTAFGFQPLTASAAVVAARPPRAFPPMAEKVPPRNQPPPGRAATARTSPDTVGKDVSRVPSAAASASALPVAGESSVKSPPMYVTSSAGATAHTVPLATHVEAGSAAGAAE